MFPFSSNVSRESVLEEFLLEDLVLLNNRFLEEESLLLVVIYFELLVILPFISLSDILEPLEPLDPLDSLSSFLEQEMMVKLRRDIRSMRKTFFIFSSKLKVK
jgi:hypothetical protein